MSWLNSFSKISKMRALLPRQTANFELAGKVALVTGGADGIGWETAKQLRDQGTRLAIVDRNAEALARVTNLDNGECVLAIEADVTDRGAMQQAIEQIIAHFGQLDLVIANAGITPPPATLRTSDLTDFDKVIAVNLTGVLNTVHPAIEELVRQQGHVLIVGSAAAFCPPVGGVAYMVSKAAVEQLARGLKLELAAFGVSVTLAYFGVVETQLARATLDNDVIGKEIGKRLPASLRKRLPARAAGQVLIKAIRQRAPSVIAPAAWEGYARLRGIANPVIDRLLTRDAELAGVLSSLEARTRG